MRQRTRAERSDEARADRVGSTAIVRGSVLEMRLARTRRLHASAAPLALAFAMVGAFNAHAQSVVLSGDTDPLAAADIDDGVDLLIGASGVGAMTVSGGAEIISATGSIGDAAGGDGGVLVTGLGSSWETLGNLYIGGSGLGRLRIEDRAKVLSAEAVVGADSGGDVVVTGAGTNWVNTGQLTIGSYGQGDLLVEAGGKVSSNQGYIGSGAGADGHVTVTGPGSSWVTTAYNINVGNFGTGTLRIENGGLVRAVAGLDLGFSAPTASGTLVLGDAGASLAVLETTRISAGQGTASVTIDGGVLRALQDRSSFLTNFGARDVTLGANGAVIDTNGYNIGIAPRFVGTGTLTKIGTGVLALTGSNTYAGATQVNAGRLDINGDQSGAAGLTTVNLGGTLGGAGIVGGDVEAVGGKISPGAAGAPGTLTINGNLVLDAASSLDYRLGHAGAVGGLLNDLLVVHGDLTLDGVLNVTQSAGGTFGPGVYRLIDYDGALLDQGLSLGVLPGAGTKSVQTAIAQQVNLVFTAPPGGGGGGGGGDPPPPPPPRQLNFWDGDAGGADDRTITGGDGVWHGATGSVWTQADGATNGRFVNGIFAIFTAKPGTVTVDSSPGAISVSGLQFASDGYKITGGAVRLDAGDAIVRVGDGTSAGAAFKTIIASELTGPGQLHKTDLGTLILTGANSYTGATRISSGVLQLGDGGTGGSILGDVQNDGRLAFNRADELAFAGVISGGGVVAQIGSGVTTLSGDSSAFGGRIEVRRGTLAVGGKLGGGVEVLDGGRLTGHGQVGSLLNQAGGIVAPGDFGALTVVGGYEGRGGTLRIDAVLGGDDSQTDRLLVRGATSGSTLIEVANRGGLGAQTSNGILVVDVEGASSGVFTLAKGDFRLGGENALIAGAYAYVLRQDVKGGDWKLRSSVSEAAGPPRPADPDQPVGEPGAPVEGQPQVTLYQPGAPVYEAYAQTLQALNSLSTMRQRVGARQWSGEQGSRVWGRMEGAHVKLDPAVSTTQAKLETDRWKVQFGVDQALTNDVGGGRLVGALTAHYGEASTSVGSPFGGGSLDGKSMGVGATLTWINEQSAYVDAQAQASWFETDLRSSVLGDRIQDANANGYAFSVEAGQPIAAGGVFNLIPQAQLTYTKVEFHTFVDPLGARISADQGDSLLGRLGLSLDRDWEGAIAGGRGRIYGVANLTHEFLDGSRVEVSGAPISNRAERTWGGLAAGASYAWGAGRYQVYGEGSIETSLSHFGDSYAAYGSAGVRMRF